MSTAASFEIGGVDQGSDLEAATPSGLKLVETVPSEEASRRHDQLERIGQSLRLQEVTIAAPNRTGYRLDEVNGRGMTITVGTIFAECGGKLELIGTPEADAEDTLALRFPYDAYDTNNNYRAAFDDMLDGFSDKTGYDLRLFPLPRQDTDGLSPPQEIYQLYTYELHEQMRLIRSGVMPDGNLQEIIAADVAAKWHLADHVIELRETQGWRPADYL